MAVLENVGTDDLVVNWGVMLGNGKRQLPTAGRLALTDGPARRAHWGARPSASRAGLTRSSCRWPPGAATRWLATWTSSPTRSDRQTGGDLPPATLTARPRDRSCFSEFAAI